MTHQRTTMVFNISPPKSGTTALFHCLARCADIAVPKVKEPRFFARKVGMDIGNLPKRLNCDGRFSLGFQWFEGLYKEKRRYRLDFSTYYSVTAMTPELMQAYDAKARLIMILRDPVDRVVSQYFHYVKTGVVMPPITDLLDQRSDLSRYFMRFADYRAIYKRFLESFPADQIELVDFRNLVSHPEAIDAQISQFLDIGDFSFRPSTSEKNPSGRARSLLIQRLLSGGHLQYLSQLAPFSHERVLKFRRQLVAWNTKPTQNPVLNPEIRAHLRAQLQPQYNFIDAAFGSEQVRHAA